MIQNASRWKSCARRALRVFGTAIGISGISLGVCLAVGAGPGPGPDQSSGGRPEEILSWRHRILSDEEYARLATEWEAYVRAHPDDPRALVQWGNALRYAGKSDSVAYARAFQADSTDAAAIVAWVTRSLVSRGDETDWRLDHARLLRARDRDPGYPGTYYMLCWTAFRAGDWKLMNDCFRRVVELGDMPQPLYDLGYNILAGAAQGSIILTNGDNDTYPPLAVQAKDSFRTDVRIVNLSLLNLKWYIRSVRDTGVPIPLSDSEIAALKHTDGETISAQVQKALCAQEARQGWQPPLYYAVTVPDWNQAAAGSRTLAGMLERVGPAKEGAQEKKEKEKESPLFDADETRRLIDHVYRLESIQDPAIDWNRESVLRKLAMNYIEILSRLGTSLEEETPARDGGPYLSKAIALATFHHRLDVAQKLLDQWQKLEKK